MWLYSFGFFFLPYPPLRVVSMPLLSTFPGLKDRNPVGRWFSYLFKLLVIIQPSLTHFCLFLFFFPSHFV